MIETARGAGAEKWNGFTLRGGRMRVAPMLHLPSPCGWGHGSGLYCMEPCRLQRLQRTRKQRLVWQRRRNIECISFRHSVPKHHAHAYYLSRHGSTHTSRCSPSIRNAPCPCLHATSTSSIMRHRLPDLNVMPCSRPNCTCTCPHRCPSGLPSRTSCAPRFAPRR